MEQGEGRVCVTGAGGFVASWLVKLLLSKGYMVHGTVRNPDDEKNNHLKSLEKAQENLQLFKADLLDYDSLYAAIEGCNGVFHVASPVPPSNVANPEARFSSATELLEPAVRGTLNVLKVCSETGVERVVVVSSAAAVTFNPSWPPNKPMDEDCWTDVDYCRESKAWYTWYCIAKTTAEREALKYAENTGLDVVTVCPSYVFGPLLQPTMNTSTRIFIDLFKGRSETVENRIWAIVDVRDVAEALLLVYKKKEASGRYICSPRAVQIHSLVEKLKSKYPDYNYPKNYIEVDPEGMPSSEKLKRLGWECRSLEETIADSVESYQEAGILNKD
ncbi:cinnamoyl-CoA reductase 1-like protein [Cinnamomum micranthum f. kanehirae]|uniref:Cinnamoyl-CoA reductase 1-like protein n=1 Tax=Cinnamomum micranthum f. kanehirae TaxID=337451 RepID=A0A3S3N3X8_9MAGN|nr:cinnamoyl-CoA reductase 1-like protein [Cinnamomum micranthum f. kanehirae]